MGRKVAVLMGRKAIKAVQAERALKFPPDRIAFYHGDNAALEDALNMRRCAKGEITLPMLCRLLERSNYLEVVTEEQAINEMKITGWL